MDITVSHIEQDSRFLLLVDGQEAGLLDYQERDGIRDFVHTRIYSRFEGQGLSKPLIAHALDASEAAGFKVIPSCSAVAHYIDKYR